MWLSKRYIDYIYWGSKLQFKLWLGERCLYFQISSHGTVLQFNLADWGKDYVRSGWWQGVSIGFGRNIREGEYFKWFYELRTGFIPQYDFETLRSMRGVLCPNK